MTPARKATAIAVPAALIAGLVTAWVISSNIGGAGETGPLEKVTVQEAEGTDDICANVVIGLPDTLDGRQKRAVTGHPGSLAWGDPPITLVCGVPKPEGIETETNIIAVNGVDWLVKEATDTSDYGLPGENVLWTAVDREVYVSVAVPADASGSGVISPISKVLGERLKGTGA